jgi:hypothetical protein
MGSSLGGSRGGYGEAEGYVTQAENIGGTRGSLGGIEQGGWHDESQTRTQIHQQRILRLGDIARNQADLVPSPESLPYCSSNSLVSCQTSVLMEPTNIQPQKPNTRKWSPSSTTD